MNTKLQFFSRLCGAVVALLTLVAGAAPWLGRISDQLDLFAHVTPFLLLAPLANLVVNRHAGWPRHASIFAIVSIALALMSALTWVGDGQSGVPVRIISMNVWTHNRDPVATAAWIRNQRPDFIMLQEDLENGAIVDRLLRETYPFRTRTPAFAPCGSVILSKHSTIDQGFTPSPDPRGSHCAVWARYQVGDQVITLVNVHMLWPTFEPWRRSQDHAIAAAVQSFSPETMIVAGDFNATPWSQALKRQTLIQGLKRRDQILFTWPMQPWSRHRYYSPTPILALDHIFAGHNWIGHDVSASPRLGSTHRGLVATLYLKPAASK